MCLWKKTITSLSADTSSLSGCENSLVVTNSHTYVILHSEVIINKTLFDMNRALEILGLIDLFFPADICT